MTMIGSVRITISKGMHPLGQHAMELPVPLPTRIAHPYEAEGYKIWHGEEGADGALEHFVMTVFSAPNYCGNYGNTAAVVQFIEAGLSRVARAIVLTLTLLTLTLPRTPTPTTTLLGGR